MLSYNGKWNFVDVDEVMDVEMGNLSWNILIGLA